MDPRYGSAMLTIPELTLMILPEDARSNGSRRCETAMVPMTFVSSWLRIRSIGTHSNGALIAIPALFTKAQSPVSRH